MKEKTLIICVPTSHSINPIPGTRQMQCSVCSCGIWIAPGTVRDIPSQRGEIIFQCYDCAMKELNEAITKGEPMDFLPLTDNQRRDIAAFKSTGPS